MGVAVDPARRRKGGVAAEEPSVRRVELSASPRLGPLFRKAALSSLRRRTRGDALPAIGLVLPESEVDPGHLASYAHVCGFRLRDELPPTYPHVLAFPLAMRLLTDPSFPFPPAGLLHVENRIEQQRPLLVSERPTLEVTARDLRPHPRGSQFDVVTTASVDGVEIWHEWSTYLKKHGSREPRRDGEREGEEVEPTALWRIPKDVGRRYAAVSGDRNPIHLYPLTARLLGQRRPIAHGMWLFARCVAALEGRVPSRVATEVAFKRPVALGSSVAFVARADGDEWRFSLKNPHDGRTYVDGSVGPLPAPP